MSDTVITVENLSKRYRLGEIGSTTLRATTERLWHRLRGRDPDLEMSVIGRTAGGRRRVPEDGKTDDSNEIWALKDVAFEVKRGEVLGIIGKNGAGKSTLLKILTRITEPTSGRAVMRGRVASLLEVGTGFHPELTGRENVYLNGAILGMKKLDIDRKFDEIVAFAEVEKFVDTPVKRYSSGMYVRLAFAVAAHLEPEILLVDEVLAVGDAGFQRKCLGKMGDVAKAGRTVLFVSHNMFAVQNLCHKAMLLENGRQTCIGDAGHVVRQYLDEEGVPSGRVEWMDSDVSPGTDFVSLVSMRIVAGGRRTSEPLLSEEFVIETEYLCRCAACTIVVGIVLHNEFGVCVMSSSNLPSVCAGSDSCRSLVFSVGRFRSSCRIPSHLLNSGKYTLSLYVNSGANYLETTSQERVLSFTVRDDGDMRREYSGEWLGVVRPRLEWNTSEV